MSTSGAKQKLIEQLRAEASINRIKVSVACMDLVKYCTDHQNEDVLCGSWTSSFPPNPYKEKQPCVML